MNPGATISPRASMTLRALAAGPSDLADRRDPVSADGDVALEPGIPRPVDDPAAADEHVPGLRRSSRGLSRPRTGENQEAEHGRDDLMVPPENEEILTHRAGFKADRSYLEATPRATSLPARTIMSDRARTNTVTRS